MLHDYRFNIFLATNAETSDASSTWLIRVKSFVTVRTALQNRTYPLREYRKCRVSCNRPFYHNYQFPESYILEHHVGHRKQQPLANAFCRSGSNSPTLVDAALPRISWLGFYLEWGTGSYRPLIIGQHGDSGFSVRVGAGVVESIKVGVFEGYSSATSVLNLDSESVLPLVYYISTNMQFPLSTFFAIVAIAVTASTASPVTETNTVSYFPISYTSRTML